MHELSLAQSLMDVVVESAAREGISRVRRINIIIGEWSAIIPDALTGSFEMLAAESGGLFAQAELNITKRPAMGQCKACGAEFPAEAHGLICPQCGSAARLLTGLELAVDSYEGD
ncbi:MAG TPA: hydrogenase maturation nickel metallochaperone HypA [Symbiobacteriaceae bacterium]|nr:hydrogenase maturation nickel metallochaperone HypA [Symbiobacteriaceae bacterium]